MYYYDSYIPEVILPSMPIHRLELKKFLQRQNLAFDEDIEYSIVLRHDDSIIATGSYSKNILKCIAIQEEYKGMGLSEKIVSLLMVEKYMAGEEHLLLFSKEENKAMFRNVGFHKIAQSNQKTILMETPKTALEKYMSQLKTHKRQGEIRGSIVANCNPFTLGHLYLMEYAARRCDVLYVFILSEDQSVFPSAIRYKLVEEGTKHISNMVIVPSGNYIISAATFPSYFLKDKNQKSREHAEIDISLFGNYIGPSLGITKRFIGSEEGCQFTAQYNQIILDQLPLKGIEVEEVARLKVGPEDISASKVRALMQNKELDQLKKYVPQTTYDFLTSYEGEDIFNKQASRRG